MELTRFRGQTEAGLWHGFDGFRSGLEQKRCERFWNLPKYHIYKKSYVFNFWRNNEICKNLFNPRLPDSLDGLHGVVEKAGIDDDAGHHALSVRENRPEIQADFSQAWRFLFLRKKLTRAHSRSRGPGMNRKGKMRSWKSGIVPIRRKSSWSV